MLGYTKVREGARWEGKIGTEVHGDGSETRSIISLIRQSPGSLRFQIRRLALEMRSLNYGFGNFTLSSILESGKRESI